VNNLFQRLRNDDPQVESHQLTLFVNKIFLEHICVHLPIPELNCWTEIIWSAKPEKVCKPESGGSVISEEFRLYNAYNILYIGTVGFFVFLFEF
jgi:hypothetical protein